MSKTYDNPEFDPPRDSVQNTWKHGNFVKLEEKEENQETPQCDELNSLVIFWQKRQREYEDLAEKHRDCEHTYKKYTYRAQATRDCWKELLTLIKKKA